MTSPNIVVSRNTMRVLEMVLNKVSTNRLQGISQMIIQIFLTQYKGLNSKMSITEAKFLGQLLSTVGICLKAFKNQFTDD